MDELGKGATQAFATDYSEQKLCGDNNLAMDFYFPDEETSVEVAGMLGDLGVKPSLSVFSPFETQGYGGES